MLTPKEIQQICDDHDAYWNHRRDHLRECRAMYMTRFWKKETPYMDNILRTEVPKAYAVVESYLGSLYAKNPSVFVTPDIRGRGNPDVAEATANLYLKTVREQVEDATRLALIYPCAFLKMAPVESVDPLKRVSCSSLPPWEVIVDSTAPAWSQQRWVGHTFLMPVEEAMARYGKGREQFRTRAYTKWIEATGTYTDDEVYMGQMQTADSPYAEWIKVVEIYDLSADKLLIWSPDFANGQDYLFTGVKVQIGALDEDADAESEKSDLETEIVHETTGIPYKSASGRPVVPIIPFYFSRDPDTPLRGYSLVSRNLDQYRELNVLRTYQAQGVRRMARQWMVRSGFLSEDAAAKIAQGLDGEFIEVDLQPGAPLTDSIAPVPNTPIPADIQNYAITVDNDIKESGLLAPFTRGEVTKSTATEQNLLATYTSNEVGRMARTRDAAISEISFTYNVMLAVILGDEGEPLSLPNPIGPMILSADDLTGDFQYHAVDPATTPMNDLAKRATLQQLTPLLVQLGVDPAALLEEIVRTFQLPEEFVAPPPPPPTPEAPASPGMEAPLPPGAPPQAAPPAAPGAAPVPPVGPPGLV